MGMIIENLPGMSLGQAIENLYASRPVSCISFISSYKQK